MTTNVHVETKEDLLRFGYDVYDNSPIECTLKGNPIQKAIQRDGPVEIQALRLATRVRCGMRQYADDVIL